MPPRARASSLADCSMYRLGAAGGVIASAPAPGTAAAGPHAQGGTLVAAADFPGERAPRCRAPCRSALRHQEPRQGRPRHIPHGPAARRNACQSEGTARGGTHNWPTHTPYCTRKAPAKLQGRGPKSGGFFLCRQPLGKDLGLVCEVEVCPHQKHLTKFRLVMKLEPVN